MVSREKTPGNSRELVEAIKRLVRGVRNPDTNRASVSISPGCAFGAVVDQRLKDMSQQIDELKGRVNGLIFLVIGAVVVELVMKFVVGKGG